MISTKSDVLYLDNLFKHLHHLLNLTICLLSIGKRVLQSQSIGMIFTKSDLLYFHNLF